MTIAVGWDVTHQFKQTNISDLFEPSQETADIAKTEVLSTNKILVRNFTSVVDEDILETFFESRKKSGGGPVRNVQLNREKKWALIEFCEAEGMVFIFEPVHRKADNLGFRPGQTQTMLNSHRIKLEASNFGYK